MLKQHFPVTCHTDHVGPASTFVCIHGMKKDGTEFIPLALSKGATKIVVERSAHIPEQMHERIRQHGATIEFVDDARAALAQLSAQAAGFPAKQLRIIGITGTKGKTTVSFILRHILAKLGKRVAMLSTVHNAILDTIYPAELTTAQPDYLHQFLKTCVEQNVEWVVLEIAAQAFSLNRVDTIELDAAIYTNVSPEHGEFYPTFIAYTEAKSRIFNHLKTETAPIILNADDPIVKAQGWTCNRNLCHPIFLYQDRMQRHAYPETLLGDYNAHNAYMALNCLEALGLGYEKDLAKLLDDFPPVPGRLEKYVLKNGARAYIDYAHNHSSTKAVLSALREHTTDLIVVIGCSGDRDKTKRPHMGAEAALWGNTVYVTSDNPRSEDPDAIIRDVVAGIPQTTTAHVIVDADRGKAIRAACAQAKPESIIAILGKGPDEYTIIKGVKYPFIEKNILTEFQ